jgi:hypothetical protein
MGNGEASFAPDDHEGVDVPLLECGEQCSAVVTWLGVTEFGMLKVEGVSAVGGAEDRATADEEPSYIIKAELACAAQDCALVAVSKADNLPPIAENSCLDHGADSCIQPWCIATAS